MTEVKRKIHILGLNSFNFEELPHSSKKLFKNIQNIAVPESYSANIQKWLDKSTNKQKTFFFSKSDQNLIDWLRKNNDDVLLISRGDPLWFGIGRILLENFTKDELIFYPSNTCVQLAASKLKIPWQDIFTVSMHGRDSTILTKAIKNKKPIIAIITDSKKSTLELIRKNLIELQLDNFYEFWLCEELGFRNELIRKIAFEESFPKDISSLNIVFLLKQEQLKKGHQTPLFGLRDSSFKTYSDRPNLLTKREVRIQILADLELPEKGILWDIGAGCGTIGLEALRLRPKLKLVSIDKRFGTKAIITENAKRLNVSPQKIIEQDIKLILKKGLPKHLNSPNRVVIGGCDKATKISIIKYLSKDIHKGDIIVLPIITYEAMQEIQKVFQDLDYETNLNLIQTYKGLTISEGTRFEPNNPIFIIKGQR